jgi:hypothetical protein
MRAGSRGVATTRALAVVAVTPSAVTAAPMLRQQFEALGFSVAEQPQLSRSRRDLAAVISAHRSTETEIIIMSLQMASALDGQEAASSSLPLQPPSSPPPIPAFQPVWNLTTWSYIGLDLFVIDDNDARCQLDVLAHVLARPRSSINIKPRAGWQRYGHPDVQALS